jgi:hypothetical protein
MNARRIPFAFLVVYLLFSTAVFAQSEIVEVFPPNPTVEDEITLAVTLVCVDPSGSTVTRVGNVIKVYFPERQGICSPPAYEPHTVRVGRLEAGSYRVEVAVGVTDSVYGVGQFVVRDVHAERPFRIRPATVPAHGGLPVYLTPSPCPADDCTGVSVVIGETVLSGDAIFSHGNQLSFMAPAHPIGSADVVVRVGNTSTVLEDGLHYYDAAGVPDLSLFERVLFPIVYEGPGAGGSLWTSEAHISNPGPTDVELLDPPTPLPSRILAGRERQLPQTFARGVYIWAPRSEADQLTFSLRVRDVSRETESYGTEIPVVRESEMARPQTTMTLLDVPFDPRYRAKLRIYAYPRATSNTAMQAHVVTVNTTTGVRRSRVVDMIERCSGPSCRYPSYAEIDYPPAGTGEHGNIYVSVDPEGLRAGPAWSFVTVTNNVTQQVTIVTPDGEGGEPCAPCEVP